MFLYTKDLKLRREQEREREREQERCIHKYRGWGNAGGSPWAIVRVVPGGNARASKSGDDEVCHNLLLERKGGSTPDTSFKSSGTRKPVREGHSDYDFFWTFQEIGHTNQVERHNFPILCWGGLKSQTS
jgi:hypothetical protein